MRRYIFLLISIVILLSLTLPSIVSGNFAFVFDMGRDQLWTRDMVELRRPALIGPWGSIAGVFFGPLWFYLLSIPYLIFRGDPRGAVLVPLAVNLLTMIIGWQFLRKNKHPIAGNIFAILYSVSPLAVSLSSFAFHANLLPLTTLLFFIGLYVFHKSLFINHPPAIAFGDSRWRAVKSLFGLPLAALSASLAYHFEPAAGVMLTGFFGLALIFTRVKIRCQIRTLKLRSSVAWTETTSRSKHTLGYSIIIAIIVFLLPFLPQFIFELRHDFIQTKSLMAYFSGENTSLGGVLPLGERIVERGVKLGGTLTYSLFTVDSNLWKIIFLGIFILALLALTKLKKFILNIDSFTLYSLLFTLYFLSFHYLAYTFLFPAELKGWYLSGFVSIYILAISLILDFLYKFSRLLILAVLMFIAIRNINPVNRFFITNPSQPVPETLSSQIEVVDWIYQDAIYKNKPFAVYTYTPPIYDYQYQYLLWWRGINKYKLLPAEYSYKPGETSYLQYKDRFVSSVWKPEDARLMYLIIEPDNQQFRVDGWMGDFPKSGQLETKEFPSKVKVLFGTI